MTEKNKERACAASQKHRLKLRSKGYVPMQMYVPGNLRTQIREEVKRIISENA